MDFNNRVEALALSLQGLGIFVNPTDWNISRSVNGVSITFSTVSNRSGSTFPSANSVITSYPKQKSPSRATRDKKRWNDFHNQSKQKQECGQTIDSGLNAEDPEFCPQKLHDIKTTLKQDAETMTDMIDKSTIDDVLPFCSANIPDNVDESQHLKTDLVHTKSKLQSTSDHLKTLKKSVVHKDLLIEFLQDRNNEIENRNTQLEDIEQNYIDLKNSYEEQKSLIEKFQNENVTLKSNSTDHDRNQSRHSHDGKYQRHSRNSNPGRPFARRAHSFNRY